MPRRAVTELTTAFVRSAPARDGKRTDYADALCRGLTLRVSPDGARTFTFRYQDQGGRSMRLRLGDYPALSLAKAREAGYAARGRVGLGGDPQREKRAARAIEQARRVRTVAELIDDYLAAATKRNRDSTVDLNTQRLESHVKPKLGALRIEEVTRADVRGVMADLERAGHQVTANRCLSLIGCCIATHGATSTGRGWRTRPRGLSASRNNLATARSQMTSCARCGAPSTILPTHRKRCHPSWLSRSSFAR